MATQSRAPYHKTNWAAPLAWLGGRLRSVRLAQRYEAAVRHLLMTPKGSLYAHPDYGSIIYQMRTQGVNSDRTSMALAQLRQAASKYIPDIQIIELSAFMDDAEQKLSVTCVWIVRNATSSQHGELAGQRSVTVLV